MLIVSTSFLFGDYIPAFGVLMVLTALDILTGIAKGFYDKALISRKMSQGMIMKAMMFIVIIVGHQIDIVYNAGVPLFKFGVITFYIYMEAVSILENLGQMKAPLPDFIKQRLQVLKEEANKGGNANGINN